jgi:hypothetical protein
VDEYSAGNEEGITSHLCRPPLVGFRNGFEESSIALALPRHALDPRQRQPVLTLEAVTEQADLGIERAPDWPVGLMSRQTNTQNPLVRSSGRHV